MNQQLFIALLLFMIKLKLNLESSTSIPIANKKVLVDLNTCQQLNVLSFLQRIIKVCGISQIPPQELQLFDGEFILPHQLSTSFISTQKLYEVSAHQLKKKRIEQKKNEKNVQKILNRKQKKSRKIYSNSLSSLEQSSSSSQLKSYPSKKPNIKVTQTKKNQKQKKLKKSNQKLTMNSISKIKNNKLSQSSQSQSMSQQKIKQDKRNKTQIVKSAKNNSQIKLHQKNQRSQKLQLKNINKKVSQSSQSQVYKMQPKNYKEKVSQILSNISERTHLIPSQVQKNIIKNNENNDKTEKNIKKPTFLPISVRNVAEKTKQKQQTTKKTQQKNKAQQVKQKQHSFKQYMQMKWISITKQIVNKWKQVHKTQPILTQNNEIRFKIMELDQQKFIPVNSGWINGFVTKVDSSQKDIIILLQTATKASRQQNGGTQQLKNYEIPIHNMQEIQIHKNTLNQQQKQILNSSAQKQQTTITQRVNLKQQNKQKVNQYQQKIQNIQNRKEQPKKEIQQTKNTQSIQDFICGQINYYFGDKNYSTDLFMQMHANNDAQRFIQIKLMLNFPKIKKVLTDEKKLWDYVTSDNRYASRNYQLDLKRKMIRKKNS